MDKYKFSFEYEHKIGETVYHKSSGDKGTVNDVIYSCYTNRTKYSVSFGRTPDDEVVCTEFELSKEKVVI